MALASLAAGADGVMLEVHPDPLNAAVDPLQPLDFRQFEELMFSMSVLATALGKTLHQ
jgi:3-deoxy-7-phosphoheptulonate synthase